MSTATAAVRQGVLADTLVPSTALVNAALVVGVAGLTSVTAQRAEPLWPVPITGRTLRHRELLDRGRRHARRLETSRG
ncbi:hypothetical protein [Arthrobacter sp. NPDC089319]|uniref:hypothetical protein n=1 Tax=Arthrobacter sp. NPDC089319 TaxID=3155915 RepID=UPI0034408E8E